MSKDAESFEKELAAIAPKLKTDDAFAQRVYAALCNQDWQRTDGQHTDECMLVIGKPPEYAKGADPWCNCGAAYSCSWRYAGGLIADLREKGENYMDFYCSGGEGHVTEDVREAMKELGWVPVRLLPGDSETQLGRFK